VSFDHHQVCPKCSKDILAEQRRLNLPDYKPEPPFFLGALTGEGGPATGPSASSEDSGATIKFDEAPRSPVRDDTLSPASEVTAHSAVSPVSSAPDRAPDGELELDLDELSLDLDEESGSESPSAFQFDAPGPQEDAISLELGEPDPKGEKPSNGGSAPSDRNKLEDTLALEEGMNLGENKMGFDTAEMLTLELDRKLDATSSELGEEELDDFEFDIDLDELKEIKD